MQRKGAAELSFLKRAFCGELSWATELFLGRVKMLGGELVWAAYECVATVSLKVAAWAWQLEAIYYIYKCG